MPSGENGVVDADVQMLRDAGVDVCTFFRDSDAIEGMHPVARVKLAASPTISVSVANDFRRILKDFRADIVHIHNPFPLISPSVIRIAARAEVPVVQSVHNYPAFLFGIDWTLPRRTNL